MASPNLINANTILGKTTGANLTATSMTTLVNNGASSNKILKINVLNMTNYGANTIAVSASYYTTANQGGTEYKIASDISVPSGTVITVIDKTSGYYMEEDSSLAVKANVANSIFVTASYEEIA